MIKLIEDDIQEVLYNFKFCTSKYHMCKKERKLSKIKDPR